MRTKKLIAVLLATAMVITGISVAPKQEAEAAAAKGIIYEIYGEDYSVAASLIEKATAPVFNGVSIDVGLDSTLEGSAEADITDDYLFGGWYIVYESGDVKAVESASELSGLGELDLLLIKWVSASLLSVKAQNNVGVASGDKKAANIRVLSSVDSLDYEKVGFSIEINNNGDELDGAAAGTTKVYETLIADGTPYAPSTIFGAGAEYFITWRLAGIPDIGDDDIIYVRPYWVTADGTRVDGLGKYVHVEDGYNGYISVPINLNVLSEEEVAAGVVEISYPTGLTLVEDEFETGRVFEEREFADKGTSVKIAANVQNINGNKKANDIYMNLRFKVTDISKLDKNGDGMVHTECDFVIIGTPDFCDNSETPKPIDIWDVLY